MLRASEHTLIPSSFVIFNFGLTFESFKECGVCHLQIKMHLTTINITSGYEKLWPNALKEIKVFFTKIFNKKKPP
jgi:hypothetical protein